MMGLLIFGAIYKMSVSIWALVLMIVLFSFWINFWAYRNLIKKRRLKNVCIFAKRYHLIDL